MTAQNADFAFVISKNRILEAKTCDLLVTKAGNGQKVHRDNDPPTVASLKHRQTLFPHKSQEVG